MGALIFDPEILADNISEKVGNIAGLALSIEEICDHLSGTSHPDLVVASEKDMVRIRAEDYEDLFYEIFQQIGFTEKRFTGDKTGIFLFDKYKDTAPQEYLAVTELFVELWPQLIEQARLSGTKAIDPTPFFEEALRRIGPIGANIAAEKVLAMHEGMRVSPFGRATHSDWSNVESLERLFESEGLDPAHGQFLDQRFIDYLTANTSKLPKIHWRNFERLTAEFFEREGYKVELGPGRNDDGIDVRVWDATSEPRAAPLILVQCKRQKADVEKVIVKGLYADLLHAEAEQGVIVTTSRLAPGASKTIAVRGYPIQEVNFDGVQEWLKKLRTPGTGIVRV